MDILEIFEIASLGKKMSMLPVEYIQERAQRDPEFKRRIESTVTEEQAKQIGRELGEDLTVVLQKFLSKLGVELELYK